jgi:hypothetical protein
MAALAAAGWAATDGVRAEQAQAGWRQVPAVLFQDAPDPAHALFQASLEPLVLARWAAPGRAWPEGGVYASGGARAGTTVIVRTDGSGRREGLPVQPADVTMQEAFAALAAAVLAAAAVVVTGFLARRALDQRRLAAWDADWSRTGPQWTGRP